MDAAILILGACSEAALQPEELRGSADTGLQLPGIWPRILTVTHTAQAALLFPIFIIATEILFRTVVYKDLIIEK